ncbi:hypothetical protein [Helicobacter cetorum]|uniref:Uncharacterized protein n=1 Tax=Helicobacter cetorum (strain ATCC BAA-429 / MIT 00-7128) TaxID=182217 RepID=I0EML3_HELC0|nr:hypothetical protein [Helicobacter cetorum]AFI04182.1 hypothetical protein HCW_04575 [Helicobacter cetorum MIT 00-7128]
MKAKVKKSKFKTIFWGTILILFVLYILARVVAFSGVSTHKKPLSVQYSKKILMTMGNNLSEAEKRLNTLLNQNISEVDKVIEENINKLFKKAKENIDDFLDFHYSLKGDYTEIGLKLGGKMGLSAEDAFEKMLQEKMFGKDFDNQSKDAFNQIYYFFQNSTKRYVNALGGIATKGLNDNLSKPIMQSVDFEINKRLDFMLTHTIALSSMIGVAKISSFVSAKLASKLAFKGIIKVASKGASALTGAGVGLSCGALAWICAPIGAVVAWFATDSAVIKGDEILNREEFKKDILKALNEQKQILINLTKNHYESAYEDISKLSKKSILEKHFN